MDCDIQLGGVGVDLLTDGRDRRRGGRGRITGRSQPTGNRGVQVVSRFANFVLLAYNSVLISAAVGGATDKLYPVLSLTEEAVTLKPKADRVRDVFAQMSPTHVPKLESVRVPFAQTAVAMEDAELRGCLPQTLVTLESGPSSP